MSQIKKRGATLVAICPQRPEFLKQMSRKHALTFDILRDEGNNYAEAMGLRFVMPVYLQEAYLKASIDLPRLNGESSWSLAIPARYVVRRDGIISAADYDIDYTRRPEPEKTLTDLDNLL